MYKTRITDLDLLTTPLTNGCRNDDMISLANSVLSRCFNSSRSVIITMITDGRTEGQPENNVSATVLKAGTHYPC